MECRQFYAILHSTRMNQIPPGLPLPGHWTTKSSSRNYQREQRSPVVIMINLKELANVLKDTVSQVLYCVQMKSSKTRQQFVYAMGEST
jgi:hypothetical protein